MIGIYKFYWDSGRGVLEGIFTESSENVKKIYNKEIYFGEVLGKHSEVIVEIEEGEITLVTDDQEAVNLFERYNMHTGYNPFIYLADSDEYWNDTGC